MNERALGGMWHWVGPRRAASPRGCTHAPNQLRILDALQPAERETPLNLLVSVTAAEMLNSRRPMPMTLTRTIGLPRESMKVGVADVAPGGSRHQWNSTPLRRHLGLSRRARAA